MVRGEIGMTNIPPFAKYCLLLESRLPQRIPDDPEAKRAMCRRLRGEGSPVAALARQFGVSRQTIRDWCMVKTRAFRHSPETKDRYLRLRRQGLSTRKAAAAIGVGRGTVAAWECRPASAG